MKALEQMSTAQIKDMARNLVVARNKGKELYSITETELIEAELEIIRCSTADFATL